MCGHAKPVDLVLGHMVGGGVGVGRDVIKNILLRLKHFSEVSITVLYTRYMPSP